MVPMSLWLVMALGAGGWAVLGWWSWPWTVGRMPGPLVAMAVGAGLLGLLANRPDADDGFYLARAMMAWETPWAPIRALYPFAFVDGAGGVFPSLPAWEHFAAGLGVLGLGPPVSVQHGVIAFAAGALVPLAWFALLRRLAGEGPALGGVAMLLGLMLLDGTTHRGIADFGLLRIWQGKVVLVWVLAPLALAVALDVARGGRGLMRLVGVGVAGIGLSTTAAFLLPVLVGCGGGAFWLVWRGTRVWRPVAAGLAVFVYPALVVLPFQARLAGPDAIFADSIAHSLGDVVALVYGGLAAPLVLAGAVGLAGLAVAGRWRWLAWVALWAAAVAGPLAWEASARLIVRHVTTADALWRLAYAGPVVLLAAAGVMALLAAPRWRWAGGGPVGATWIAALVLGVAGVAPSPFAASNVVFPSRALKLPAAALADGRAIVHALPPGRVLAPWVLSTVLPVLSGRHRLAIFREFDAVPQLVLDGQPARAAALAHAHNWISARTPALGPGGDGPAALAALVAGLDAVILSPGMDRLDLAIAALADAGFNQVALATTHLVFRRP